MERRWLSLLGAVFALGLIGAVADDSTELAPGQRPRKHDLKGGQEQAFKLVVRAGQLLSLEVVQDGIDVVAEIRDPRGKSLLEVDSPNGIRGPEPVLLVAEVSGRHTLVVRALQPEAPAGRYSVEKIELRVPTPRDRERAEALRLNSQAYALRAELRQREALPLAERALTLQEKWGDAVSRANALSLLGYLYDEVGDYPRGADAFARSLALLQKALPAGDSAILASTSNLGYLRLALGDYDAAETLFLASLSARERRGASGAGDLYGLGALSRDRGDFDRAREYLERVPERRDDGAYVQVLGTVALAQDRPEEAESLCERSRARSEGGPGFAIWTLASSLECRGLARFARGQPEAAEADLRRSLQIREERVGPGHPFVAASLTGLGRVLAAKDPAAARPLLERALHIREAVLPAGHPSIAETLQALGDLEAGAGRLEEALDAYGRALPIYEAKAPRHPACAATRLALEAVRCRR